MNKTRNTRNENGRAAFKIVVFGRMLLCLLAVAGLCAQAAILKDEFTQILFPGFSDGYLTESPLFLNQPAARPTALATVA